jgi:SSS family solute:Na+ symporter
MHLEPFDYVAVVIYLFIMAGIGFFFRWFVRDADAYLKGSNTIPSIVAGISNFMAMFSTFVFVAYAGIAYEHGLVSVTVMWSTVPACIIAALVFARRWRRAGVSSPVEYLETRFNGAVRQTIGWVGIIMRILDNMVRLYALGIFLSAVTPLSLPLSLVISSLITILFTFYGGIWAVTMMGTVQFLILILISIILCWLALDHAGGMAALNKEVPQHLGWFNGPKGNFLWLFVYYVMIIIKYNENWIFIQRFYIVKNERAAEKVGYLTAALFLIFPIIFLIPPIVTRMMAPELPDKEMAYVFISNELLPPGLMGVMLASMFAATMSSLNSEYNVIASVLSKDVYQRLINAKASGKQILKVAQVSTVLVGLLVLSGGLFIKDFGGAFEANKFFTGIFAIPIGIPLVLGIVNKRATPRGAMLTVIVGAVSGILLNSFPEMLSWETATLIETGICLVIFFSSGFWSGAETAYFHRVTAFFRRLQEPVDKIPAISAPFQKALNQLYVMSFLITAVLFIGMGLPSVNEFSGLLAVSSGAVCIVIGSGMWYLSK